MSIHLKELIGKRVDALYLDADTELYFVTDGGVLAFVAEGDCCSESWFADIVGVKALLGHVVQAADETWLPADYNVDDGRGRQEEDELYGFRLTTDAGYVDFVYRNSSNGFYGGWLDTLGPRLTPDELAQKPQHCRILEDYAA